MSVEIDLENRCIALVGEEACCRRMYLQFRHMLHIEYVFAITLTNGGQTREFWDEHADVKYAVFQERYIREKDILLVICNTIPDADRQYEDMLFNRGFEWGEDYIDAVYVIQYYRHKLRVNLENREIWIFGAGNSGKQFYEQYHGRYHICGFLSNYEEEREFMGLPVIRPADLKKEDRPYVVICSLSDDLMTRQIWELGFMESSYYGFPDTIPKKLFVALGSCQIIYTVKVLKKNTDFINIYTACTFLDNIYSPCGETDHRKLRYYGKYCAVIFYNIANTGSAEQRNWEPFISRYYKAAEKFYMPFYYFRGQLMQSTADRNDYTGKIGFPSNYIWFRGDHEVNKMIGKNLSVEEIVSKVSDTEYWTKQEIMENFNRELKKVEILDRISSVPLKQYIEDHYREQTVFVDGIHFGYRLHIYIADKIAEAIHVSPLERRLYAELEKEQKAVMPVYPCVEKALGIKTTDKCKFYKMAERKNEEVSFKRFIEKYALFVQCITKIKLEYGTFFEM